MHFYSKLFYHSLHKKCNSYKIIIINGKSDKYQGFSTPAFSALYEISTIPIAITLYIRFVILLIALIHMKQKISWWVGKRKQAGKVDDSRLPGGSEEQ